jgi:hypothetical protein
VSSIQLTVPAFPPVRSSSRPPAVPACSLRAGAATEAVSVGACVGPDGALLPDSVQVIPSVVRPSRRLTYDEVDELLVECSEEQEPDVHGLAQVGGGARLRPYELLGCGPSASMTQSAACPLPAVSIAVAAVRPCF